MIRDSLKQVIKANGRGVLKSDRLYPCFSDIDRNSEQPQNRTVFRMLCQNGDIARMDRIRKKYRAYIAQRIIRTYSVKYGFDAALVTSVLSEVCAALGRPLPRQMVRSVASQGPGIFSRYGVSLSRRSLLVWAPAVILLAVALCLLLPFREKEENMSADTLTGAGTEMISGAYTVRWKDGSITTADIEREEEDGKYLLTLYSDSRPVIVSLSFTSNEVFSQTMGHGSAVIDRETNTLTIKLTDGNEIWELTKYL